jgi:hypothetical protein
MKIQKCWGEMNKKDHYKTTAIKTAIHEHGENAIFGDSSIHVSIEDEGAGGFIKIECGSETLNIDFEDLEQVLVVATQMLDAYKRNGNEV